MVRRVIRSVLGKKANRFTRRRFDRRATFVRAHGWKTEKGKGTRNDRLITEPAVSSMSLETIRPKKVRRIDAIARLEHLFRQVFVHAANIAGFVSEFKATREPRYGRKKTREDKRYLV